MAPSIVPWATEHHVNNSAAGTLTFLWLEITRHCNLRCRHCYAGSGPSVPMFDGMGTADWCRVIDEAADLGCKEIQFIGGEPTLHPGLRSLIEHASTEGYEFIEVFTNGTLLGDPEGDGLIDVFRRFHVHVAFSAYASDVARHERMTGTPGSFALTVAGIRKTVDAGLPVRVGVIVPDGAEARLLGDATTSMLRDMGVRSTRVDRVRGIGRGTNFLRSADPFEQLCGRCWNGRLCVKPNGEATPCVFSSFCGVGNVRDGLDKVLRSQSLREFRTRSRKQAELRLNCNPDQSCSPDCTPNSDCSPNNPPCSPDTQCSPDCSPNAPCYPDDQDECLPDCGPRK